MSATPPASSMLTVVVDAMGRGDFGRSRGCRWCAARPGSRLLIRPGVYEGSVSIDKPLELVGDGPRDNISLEASDGRVIEWSARAGRIENLTIRQLGGSNCDAVVVLPRVRGARRLRHQFPPATAPFTSTASRGATIHGCRLHHCTGSGILMHQQRSGHYRGQRHHRQHRKGNDVLRVRRRHPGRTGSPEVLDTGVLHKTTSGHHRGQRHHRQHRRRLPVASRSSTVLTPVIRKNRITGNTGSRC